MISNINTSTTNEKDIIININTSIRNENEMSTCAGSMSFTP
jgi:hypothetical protein